ncbi:MAG: hypothetical protein K6G88_11060 [Lachnospiraceae bacterium]|nr:hypothetical protein [Lachnospiraceae bacterium]
MNFNSKRKGIIDFFSRCSDCDEALEESIHFLSGRYDVDISVFTYNRDNELALYVSTLKNEDSKAFVLKSINEGSSEKREKVVKADNKYIEFFNKRKGTLLLEYFSGKRLPDNLIEELQLLSLTTFLNNETSRALSVDPVSGANLMLSKDIKELKNGYLGIIKIPYTLKLAKNLLTVAIIAKRYADKVYREGDYICYYSTKGKIDVRELSGKIEADIRKNISDISVKIMFVEISKDSLNVLREKIEKADDGVTYLSVFSNETIDSFEESIEKEESQKGKEKKVEDKHSLGVIDSVVQNPTGINDLFSAW